jgi:Protein of unknown function (DUF3618)
MSEQPGVEELRGRIAATRADLGETVEALAAKADVKARAKGAVQDAADGVKVKARNAVDGMKDAMGTATSKGKNAVGSAKTRSQDAVASARSTAQGVAADARDRARELGGHTGKHAAPASGSLTIEGDTALVTSARPDPWARAEGVLLATSVGAMVGALVVWLTRPRS